LKDSQLNALKQTCETTTKRSSEEELQANLFRGTPYGHPVLGTVAGIQQIALNDVKDFARGHYLRQDLTVGWVRGCVGRIARAAETGPGRAPGRKAPESGRHLGAVSEGNRGGDHPEGHPGDGDFVWPSRSKVEPRPPGFPGALVGAGLAR